MNKVFIKFPKNNVDYEGGCILFNNKTNIFYQFTFGSGDNLSDEDIAEGFDEYVNCDAYRLVDVDKHDIVCKLFHDGFLIDEVEGLEEIDGGIMLARHCEHSNPHDIREYLLDALDFVGVQTPKTDEEAEILYGNFEYVASID